MSFEICDECGTRENSQTILAGDCRGCLRAEVARLREALIEIACIKNQDWGPDWEEIEDARKIANAALDHPKP